MLVPLCYVLLGRLLEFVALHARSREFKELEIIVLRHAAEQAAIVGQHHRAGVPARGANEGPDAGW